jgi:hypothetical protein
VIAQPRWAARRVEKRSRDVLLAGKYTPPAAAAGFLAALRSYAPAPRKR